MNMPKRALFDIEVYGNRPFLKGKLDGEDALFLLDSGAQDIVLNSRYLNRETSTGQGKIRGFTGGPIESFFTEIDEISIGDWKFGRQEVLAMDMQHLEEDDFGVAVQAIIGFRQLMHFDWLIDYKAKTLDLWERFPKNDFAIRAKIRCQYLNHLPVIEVKIVGHVFKLLVDTGADFLVLNQDHQSLIASELTISGEEKMASASPEEVDVIAGELAGFEVAGLPFGKAQIKLLDIEGFRRGYGECDGLIGFDLLSQYRIVHSWSVKSFYFLED